MNKYYIVFFVVFSFCALAAETSDEERSIGEWKFLSINTRNQSEVENLNRDVILTVVTGQTPPHDGHVERELVLQKKTRLYQEAIDCADSNKRNYSTALMRTDHDLRYGINLSCFVAGVFLPEMAIALSEGNAPLFFERFEQILYLLPVTDKGYSFVITPLFAMIPQGVYYSRIPDDVAIDIISVADRLLKKCRTVTAKSQNISTESWYFVKKNIVSLETLRMNLFLMNFYQQNQRWPKEEEAGEFPMVFADRMDYRESDGSFSCQIFFSMLKMKSEASVMPREKNAETLMRKIKDWVPFKITSFEGT